MTIKENDIYERHIFVTIKDSMFFQNTEAQIDAWKLSERGSWLLEHCIKIETHKTLDQHDLMYKTVITGYCKSSDWMFYNLKW